MTRTPKSRKLTLYQENALVTCRDVQGGQTPSLQGFFGDMVAQIRERLDPEDVLWVINEGEAERRVTAAEWLECGERLVSNGVKLTYHPIDDTTLQKMRLQKGVVIQKGDPYDGSDSEGEWTDTITQFEPEDRLR